MPVIDDMENPSVTLEKKCVLTSNNDMHTQTKDSSVHSENEEVNLQFRDDLNKECSLCDTSNQHKCNKCG